MSKCARCEALWARLLEAEAAGRTLAEEVDRYRVAAENKKARDKMRRKMAAFPNLKRYVGAVFSG